MTSNMQINVLKRNGLLEKINVDKINKSVERACEGLEDVSASEIVLDASIQLYDGIKTSEIDKSLIDSARSKIEKEPNYSNVAARLLLNCVYKEVFQKSVSCDSLEKEYRESFKTNITKLINNEILNPELASLYDIDYLSQYIKPERDFQFEYIGIQTLVDRYLQKVSGVICETPQAFFMRVAMGLALKEKKKEIWAKKFYDELSSFNYMTSTPTLFNAGTIHNQLSSCFLSTMGDSEDGIMGCIHDQARMSKYAGGLGVDVTPVRGTRAKIKSTNGFSSGPIPFIKILNDTVLAFDQGGRRKGSCAVYMEPWHIDYEHFLELLKKTGDDRRRTHELHTASWIPDLFFKKVESDEDWYMFSPHQVPKLHETYGEEFEKEYNNSISLAKQNKIIHKVVKAKDLMRNMIKSTFETGHPWFTFKDQANRCYSQKEYIIHNTNLCSEIFRHNIETKYVRGQKTEYGETAVCLAKGTKVLTSEGYKNIEECDNKFVYSPFNDDDLQYESHKFEIAKLINNGIKDVYEVKTKNGQSIKATDNHKFLTLKRKIKPNKGKILPKAEYEWKELKDLKIGDFISSVINSPVYSDLDIESIDKEFLVGGWLLGDGWQTQSSYGVCFGATEHFAKEFVMSQIQNWFESFNSKNNKYPKFEAVPDKNNVYCWASSNSEWKEFVNLKFGFKSHTAHYKFLSSQIFDSTPTQQSSFLSGLFSADGCVTDNHISYTSASKQLLIDMQILLRNFGIVSRITDSFPRKRYQGILRIHGYENKKLFRKYIGFKLCPNKQQKLDLIGDTNKNNCSNFIHTQIKSIEYIGKEEVFDLQLENQHTFIANTMTVHNCNLASLNLKNHINFIANCIDWNKLKHTIKIAIRGLDNVIDQNFYPIPETELSNKRHRPIGLGIMGFSDVLHAFNLSYDSNEAVELSERIQQFIYYHGLKASCDLAKEKGKFETFETSEWAKGVMHHDLFTRQIDIKSDYLIITQQEIEDLRNYIKKHGLRNANVFAIAPTATISYIVGCSQSIEPDYSLLFVYSTLSGNFTMVNRWFVNKAKRIGKWNLETLNKLKINNGDVKYLDVSKELKQEFARAFDIDYKMLGKCASVRQKWIDMGQSFNLYCEVPSLKRLYEMYLYFWKCGLKSTYYLRTLGASQAEKTTVEGNVLDTKQVKECSIEAMRRGEICESCQ